MRKHTLIILYINNFEKGIKVLVSAQIAIFIIEIYCMQY